MTLTTLDELQLLAFHVAPELRTTADLRLEIHQEGWPIMVDCGGYSLQRVPHPELRAHWKAAGTWRGAWPSTVVFLEDNVTVEALLHELGHLLPALPPFRDSGATELPEFDAFRAEVFAAPRIDEAEPWRDHDASFIRRCLHLRHRAIQAEVHFGDMQFGGEQYELSHGRDYLDALGDEPERLHGSSFSEIGSTPAPPEFVALFEADKAEFYARTGREPPEPELAGDSIDDDLTGLSPVCDIVFSDAMNADLLGRPPICDITFSDALRVDLLGELPLCNVVFSDPASHLTFNR